MRTGQGEKGFAKGKKAAKMLPSSTTREGRSRRGKKREREADRSFLSVAYFRFVFASVSARILFPACWASFFCSQAPFQKMHSQFRVGPLLLSHSDWLFRQKSLSFLLALSCKTFTLFANRAEKRFAQLTRAETFSSLKTSDGEEVILSQPPPSSREDLSTVLSPSLIRFLASFPTRLTVHVKPA